MNSGRIVPVKVLRLMKIFLQMMAAKPLFAKISGLPPFFIQILY